MEEMHDLNNSLKTLINVSSSIEATKSNFSSAVIRRLVDLSF